MKSRERKLHHNWWLRQRKGSITLFELMTSFLIVSITSVAIASGIYTSHGLLTQERNKKKAVQLLKGEMGYWLGRVHSAFPSPMDTHRMLSRAVTISRNPVGSNVEGVIYRSEIYSYNDPETALQPDWYELKVFIVYYEDPIEPPWLVPDAQRKRVYLELVSPMILSAT